MMPLAQLQLAQSPLVRLRRWLRALRQWRKAARLAVRPLRRLAVQAVQARAR